jgi:8-oxo-dGTP pyrophosphatase MutT (NUDIX family)
MHPNEFGPGVMLFDVKDVRFDEVAGPALSDDVLGAIDSTWRETVRQNPAMFDGPVVLCSDLRQLSHGLEVSWCRATYRYRAVRQIPGAPALSSVFVCVLQPTSDGRLLIGQMSASTSSPGLIQLPGGNLEPSPPAEELTIESVRRHASTELVEETGVVADPDDLSLWVAARTSNGNVGFFFLAPSLPALVILERYASMVAADRREGREPEFADVALVRDADDLDRMNSRSADYLRPLLDRFRST